jgi:hypothetical protein
MADRLDQHWRLTSGDYTWRLALPSDAMAMAGMMVEMAERLGKPQDCPDLFAPPVVVTLICEDKTGKIVNATYMELVADITMLSFHKGSFNSAEALMPVLAGLAYSRTIRIGRVTTLRRIRRAVRGMLEKVGYRRVDEDLEQWVFRVRD